ncbi:glycerophosphodiester phosphodiesterase family protein [Pasteurella multocida]|uniref:glycerophosphodiester phosphodiesterase family protein n=1 Tax=Pasteurella multocida TaxID=747 RepID=UPI0008FA78D7|nr:glycerophosphodiester phosphodiesterase family protein [Pasteurella multocida]MDC4235545.1 hypothetical protein [Pasteurella multocida]OIQ13720.1 hypothetical protein UR07_08365 [Pasteurella multocida subsp. multocida]PNW22806.1 hypothetical protein AP056_09350 [Pasteurella multocida subsp. multocida]
MTLQYNRIAIVFLITSLMNIFSTAKDLSYRYKNKNLLYPSWQEQKCPSWDVIYKEITKPDGDIISVRQKGDYNMNIPENSLTAFHLSYAKCRPAIEIKVRLTKDGKLIIFNDTRIGRMTQLEYNPETSEGNNNYVKDLDLKEIKRLKLININHQKTEYNILTLEEFILDYYRKNPNTLIFINPESDLDAIMESVLVLDHMIDKLNDKSLAKRFIIKVDIGVIFSSYLWNIVLEDYGIHNLRNMQFNPFLNEKSLSNFNKHKLGFGKYILTSWLNSSTLNIPIVDLEIKNDDYNFTEKIEKESIFGNYYIPKSPDIFIPNSMSELVSIVKKYNKRLGVYVPIPDYILWRQSMASGYTVNHTFGNKKPINVMNAFYNNDGSCCSTLEDNIEPNKNDMRMNLAWQKAIGGSIFTSVDSDSIDSYFNSRGILNTVVRPMPLKPVYPMKSGLSWYLGYFTKPSHSSIELKLEKQPDRCLYSSGHNNPGLTYKCDNNVAHSWGFNEKLVARMAKKML